MANRLQEKLGFSTILFLLVVGALLNTEWAASAADCHSRQKLIFKSGASLEICHYVVHRSDEESRHTLRFQDGKELVINSYEMGLAKRSPSGSVDALRGNLGTYDLAEVSKHDFIFAIEFAHVEELPLPLKLHSIDCSLSPCRLIKTECAFERAFRIPHPFLAVARAKYATIPSSDLSKNDVTCSDSHLIWLEALTGSEKAQNCFTDEKRYQNNLKTYAKEQLAFVMQNCPKSQKPQDLVPEKIPNLDAQRIVGSAPLVLPIEYCSNSETCTIRIGLKKDSKKWAKFSAVDLERSFAAEKYRFTLPSKVKIESPLYQMQLPTTQKFALYGYFNGTNFGSVQAAVSAGEKGRASIVHVEDKKTWQRFTNLHKDRRPVLLSSRKQMNDPDKWSLAKIPIAVKTAVQDELVRIFKVRHECGPQDNGADFSILSPAQILLSRANIALNPRAFMSKSGTYLIGAKVDDTACITDPYTTEIYNQEHWFFVDPLNKVRLATAITVQTTDGFLTGPIDAGDFDGDGKSEWIFRNNIGGPGPSYSFDVYSQYSVE